MINTQTVYMSVQTANSKQQTIGVLHGDTGIDVDLQFIYWTTNIHMCLLT